MWVLLSDGRVVVDTDKIDYIVPYKDNRIGDKALIVMNSGNSVTTSEMPHEIYRIIERRKVNDLQNSKSRRSY